VADTQAKAEKANSCIEDATGEELLDESTRTIDSLIMPAVLIMIYDEKLNMMENA